MNLSKRCSSQVQNGRRRKHQFRLISKSKVFAFDRVAILAVSILALGACGSGESGASSDTKLPDLENASLPSTTKPRVPPSTSNEAELLSRDALLALEKCESSSFSSGMGFDMEETLDLCEDARDQISVDQQLGLDSDLIRQYQVALSKWIYVVSAANLQLVIGNSIDREELFDQYSEFDQVTRALLDDLKG